MAIDYAASKRRQIKYMAADGVISRRPCLVHSMTIKFDAGTFAYVRVRSGLTASSTVLYNIFMKDFSPFRLRFSGPLYCPHGAYFDHLFIQPAVTFVIEVIDSEVTE